MTECSKKLRHRGKNRGLPVENLLENVLRGMQRFDKHDGSTDQERQEHPDRQHETVKHRQQHRDPIRAHRLQHLPTTLDVMKEISVREHDALGASGRAGSVDQNGQVTFPRFLRDLAGFGKIDLQPIFQKLFQ